MGTFVLLLVVLLVVLCLVYYAAVRNKKLKEEEERRKESLKQYESPEYIEKVKSGDVYPKKEKFSEITGYSAIEFDLVKSPDLCDESEELYRKIKEGDFLTCMICPFRQSGVVYVNVGWFEVGTVDRKNQRVIFDKINSMNYMYCQCVKVIEENGAKRYVCQYVYFDDKGTFKIGNDLLSESQMVNSESSDNNIKLIDLNKYLWIMPTGQLVSNLRDYYYKGGVPKFGDETEDVLDEDDTFMIQFVKDYLRGGINSVEEKSQFIRDCSSNRIYGDSSVLKIRINQYIKDTGIEFIY